MVSAHVGHRQQHVCHHSADLLRGKSWSAKLPDPFPRPEVQSSHGYQSLCQLLMGRDNQPNLCSHIGVAALVQRSSTSALRSVCYVRTFTSHPEYRRLASQVCARLLDTLPVSNSCQPCLKAKSIPCGTPRSHGIMLGSSPVGLVRLQVVVLGHPVMGARGQRLFACTSGLHVL